MSLALKKVENYLQKWNANMASRFKGREGPSFRKVIAPCLGSF